VSDKDADAKNDQKCCKSLEHGDPKDCSSKSLCSLHSQNYSAVAPTFSARLVIPGNSPTDCFPDQQHDIAIYCAVNVGRARAMLRSFNAGSN